MYVIRRHSPEANGSKVRKAAPGSQIPLKRRVPVVARTPVYAQQLRKAISNVADNDTITRQHHNPFTAIFNEHGGVTQHFVVAKMFGLPTMDDLHKRLILNQWNTGIALGSFSNIGKANGRIISELFVDHVVTADKVMDAVRGLDTTKWFYSKHAETGLPCPIGAELLVAVDNTSVSDSPKMRAVTAALDAFYENGRLLAATLQRILIAGGKCRAQDVNELPRLVKEHLDNVVNAVSALESGDDASFVSQLTFQRQMHEIAAIMYKCVR